MGGHQVRHQILLLAKPAVHFLVFPYKLPVYTVFRFTHPLEHLVRHMFRRNLQLTADMEFTELLEEFAAGVCQHIIKADTGPDEYLLYLGQVPEFPQKCNIITVVRLKVPARFREQALAARACALCQLLVAGREPEVCRGAAHIVDISFKIRLLCQQLCFLHQRFMAPGLDDPALMEGEGAKAAGAEASPVADKAELYLADSRNTSKFFIGGMVIPHVWKAVNRVHLFLA